MLVKQSVSCKEGHVNIFRHSSVIDLPLAVERCTAVFKDATEAEIKKSLEDGHSLTEVGTLSETGAVVVISWKRISPKRTRAKAAAG